MFRVPLLVGFDSVFVSKRVVSELHDQRAISGRKVPQHDPVGS